MAITAHLASPNVSAMARGGVILFFVHTSLVLMASLERGGHAPGWVRAFYIRRAFRIYPLSIVTVMLVVMMAMPPQVPVFGAVRPFVPPTSTALLSNFALLQNLAGQPDVLGVFWSLPLEVQMYVLLPACYLIARRFKWGVAGLALVALVASVIYETVELPGLWRFSALAFAPCFVSGVITYAILYHVPRRKTMGAWALPLIIAVPIALLSHPLAHANMIAAGWIVALAVGLLLPWVAELRESWLTRAAAVIARYSYGIYLLHVPVTWIAVVALRDAPLVVQLATIVVGVVMLPIAAFHWVERPAIEAGQEAVRRPAMSAAAVVPAP